MTEYIVRYEIDVEADTPEEAALIVANILRDPWRSMPPVLEIDGQLYDTAELNA